MGGVPGAAEQAADPPLEHDMPAVRIDGEQAAVDDAGRVKPVRAAVPDQPFDQMLARIDLGIDFALARRRAIGVERRRERGDRRLADQCGDAGARRRRKGRAHRREPAQGIEGRGRISGLERGGDAATLQVRAVREGCGGNAGIGDFTHRFRPRDRGRGRGGVAQQGCDGDDDTHGSSAA